MTSRKTQAHIRYKIDGKQVPGVTTIISILEKPAIHYWIAKITNEGYDWTKFRDELGDIGTLAHLMIMAHLSSAKLDTDDFTRDQIDRAENSFLSYLEWEKRHKVLPLLIETPLVSKLHNYGGTIDLYCELDGRKTLIDFKTGKALYDENTIQAVAYSHLLNENGHKVDSIKILRIGRGENEGFEVKTIANTETGWAIFLRCLAIYELQKRMKKEA